MAHLRTVHIDVPGISTHRRAKSTEEHSQTIQRRPTFSRSLTWNPSRVHSSRSPFREITVEFKANSPKLPKKGKHFLCCSCSSSKEQKNSDVKTNNKETRGVLFEEIEKGVKNEGVEPLKKAKTATSQGSLLHISEKSSGYQLLGEEGYNLLKTQKETNARRFDQLKEAEKVIVSGLSKVATKDSQIPEACSEFQHSRSLKGNNNCQVDQIAKTEDSCQKEESSRFLRKEQVIIQDDISETKMDFDLQYPQNIGESRLLINRLQESLFRERKISESKERTIENMKREIRILDHDLMEKNREHIRLSEQLDKVNCKLNSVETQNNVLGNQVRMYEESNRKIYEAHMDLRNELRQKEAAMEEMKMQSSEGKRKFQQVLEESIERQNQFKEFLQQLQSEQLSRTKASEETQSKRRLVLDILIKEAVALDVERNEHNKGSDLSASIKMARDQVEQLEEMVAMDTTLSKSIDKLVRNRMTLVDEEMARLTRDLGVSKQANEDITSVNAARRFSASEEKLRKTSTARSKARDRQQVLRESLLSLESESPDANASNLETLKNQIEATVEENITLADYLSEAHENLFTLENVCINNNQKSERLANELLQREQELTEAQTNLTVALAEKNALHLEIERMRKEVHKTATAPGSNDPKHKLHYNFDKQPSPDYVSGEFNAKEKKQSVEDYNELLTNIDVVTESARETVSNSRDDNMLKKDELEKGYEDDKKTLVVVKEMNLPSVESLVTNIVDSNKFNHVDCVDNKQLQSCNSVAKGSAEDERDSKEAAKDSKELAENLLLIQKNVVRNNKNTCGMKLVENNSDLKENHNTLKNERKYYLANPSTEPNAIKKKPRNIESDAVQDSSQSDRKEAIDFLVSDELTVSTMDPNGNSHFEPNEGYRKKVEGVFKEREGASTVNSKVQEFAWNSSFAETQNPTHVDAATQTCLDSSERGRKLLEQKCREKDIEIARKNSHICNLKNDQEIILKRFPGAQSSTREDGRSPSTSSELIRLQQENKILKTKLDVRDENLDERVKEIVEKDILICSLLQETENLRVKLEKRSKMESLHPQPVEEIKNTRESMSQVIENFDLHTTELQESIQDLPNELEQNRESASTIGKELEGSEKRRKNLEETFDEPQSPINKTTCFIKIKPYYQNLGLEEMKQKLMHCDEKMKRQERELENKSRELQEKEKEFRKISREKLWKEREIDRLEATIAATQNEMEKAEARKVDSIKQLEEERLKQQERLQLLEKQLSSKDGANQNLAEQLRNSRKEMEQIKALKENVEKEEKKNVALEEEKRKLELELKETKMKMYKVEKDLGNKQSEIANKDETIRKLNKKTIQLQEAMDEKEESLRQEEKLRMENMKALDLVKIKLEKMESEDKKHRERLFNLKSACSEANEAYEIVKRQNVDLKQDIVTLKEKFKEKDTALEITQREKNKLAQDILNATRTIDDMRKFSAGERNLSFSPDSALGASLQSSSDLYSSGPDTPKSTNSDYNYEDDESTFLGDQMDGKHAVPENGLLSTMPNMIENFRAVVRENEEFKEKLLEVVSAKEKLDRKVPDLELLSESLKSDLVARDKSVAQLQEQVMVLTEELDSTKAKLEDANNSCQAVTEKCEAANKLLDNKEQTINELQECVEILQEKEKVFDLYSKSVTEKFEFECNEKKKFEQLSESLMQDKEKLCNQLQMLEKKLTVVKAEKQACDLPSSVAMTTLEDKLDSLLHYSDELERSLLAAQTEYSELQLAFEKQQKETVPLTEHENLRDELQQQEKLLQKQEAEIKVQLEQMDTANKALEAEQQKKTELIQERNERQNELKSSVLSLEQLIATLEASDESHRVEIDELKENVRHMAENSSKIEKELISAQMKQTEVEITNEAYRDENAKLRSDLLSLTEAKCKVESKISEAQRHEKKLRETIEQEHQERNEMESKYHDVSSRCDGLESELTKAKEEISHLKDEQESSQKSKELVENKLFVLSNENCKLNDELSMARKDLVELEERYLAAVKSEEELQQKLSTASLEASKLNTAYEASIKRKNTAEKNMIDLTVRGEELEMALEKAQSEKAALKKEKCQQEETIDKLETDLSVLLEEKQKILNDLYFSTRKVLALELNLESFRNEFSVVGKELKVQRSVPKKLTAPEQEAGTNENYYEQPVVETETLIQNLRQFIKVTERSLDQIRQETRITDGENRSCQKEIDCIHKEFAFLKDNLSNIKQSLQKKSDDTKCLKDELSKKEEALQDSMDKIESLEEVKQAGQETIIQLQSKNTELENLCNEYEAKIEESHNNLVKRNQQIATLEANLTRTEQKKFTFEKELLVSNEKISSLESIIRSLKDESRGDKKNIATLEVEYAEKQTLLRDYQRTEDAHTELKLKFEELQREKEDVTMDLSGAREELRQEQIDLKNARKEAENLKKQIWNEKSQREKVEQELTDKAEKCRAFKNNLQDFQKSINKLQNENLTLEDKVKSLEGNSSSLKREANVQTADMKRLQDSLCELKKKFDTTNQNFEASERQRKQLTEELVHSEEELSKLQATCQELLKEKTALNEKIAAMNEAMEILISEHEETQTSLKQELLTTKKELSVIRSALNRNQQKILELQEELKSGETKLKTLGDKNKETLDKYWETQNQLTDTESQNDSLRSEVKVLRDKYNAAIMKVAELEELLKNESEENEKELSATNEKLIKLKSQHMKALEQRDNLSEKLQQTEAALDKHSEDLKITSNKLSEKEALFTNEMVQKEKCLADMLVQSDQFQQDLKKTKKLLKESRTANSELNERLKIALEKIDAQERKETQLRSDSEDLYAETLAKMNIIQKMKAPLYAADDFVDLGRQSWMDEDDSDDMSSLPSPRPGNPISSISHLIGSFHRTCLAAFSDNKALRGRLNEAIEHSAQLNEALQREKNDIAELKRYLTETEKKKAKLEDEAKKLRRLLDALKRKNIEFEKEKDEEINETKGGKAALEAEVWKLRESLEETNVQLKAAEEEKQRYINELETSRQQVADVQYDVKTSLNRLDEFQENALSLKKRIFELEAAEKSHEQQLQEKEKLLCGNQHKVLELEKLYDSCNQKKSELFSQVSKAEDKIARLECECRENERHKESLGNEVACFRKTIGELEQKLLKTELALEEMDEKCMELEAQNKSQNSAKETLQNLLEISKEKNISFEEALDKQKEEVDCLKKELWHTNKEKDNLQSDLNNVMQQKENAHENLKSTEAKLVDVESNLVKAFQDNEALKRENIKLQTDACADTARQQDEAGKLKAETGSLKKELNEKEKAWNDQQTRVKLLERENEFLRKDLASINGKQSQMKLDLTSTNSKLQSYVMERENWEKEVKSVLNEMEKEKSLNNSKERQIISQRMRYEQEMNFLQQRVDALERELKVMQESNEQQRHADEISSRLALEAKDMEIDTLRMRLQAKRVHAGDKMIVFDAMKGQLDARGKQIEDLMEQMEVLKESYTLEIATLREELKCAQMENMLNTKPEGVVGNSFLTSDSYTSLLESIKASRKESERLRQLLGQKMNEMRILKRQILGDRSLSQRSLVTNDLTPPPKHYGYGKGVSRSLDLVPTKDRDFMTS